MAEPKGKSGIVRPLGGAALESSQRAEKNAEPAAGLHAEIEKVGDADGQDSAPTAPRTKSTKRKADSSKKDEEPAEPTKKPKRKEPKDAAGRALKLKSTLLDRVGQANKTISDREALPDQVCKSMANDLKKILAQNC